MIIGFAGMFFIWFFAVLFVECSSCVVVGVSVFCCCCGFVFVDDDVSMMQLACDDVQGQSREPEPNFFPLRSSLQKKNPTLSPSQKIPNTKSNPPVPPLYSLHSKAKETEAQKNNKKKYKQKPKSNKKTRTPQPTYRLALAKGRKKKSLFFRGVPNRLSMQKKPPARFYLMVSCLSP